MHAIFSPTDHLGKERICNVRDQQCDRARLAHTQAARDAVPPVFQRHDRRVNLVTGLGRDGTRIVHDVGHGRHRHPRALCHILDRGHSDFLSTTSMLHPADVARRCPNRRHRTSDESNRHDYHLLRAEM